jgi:adenylate cyclase
MKILIADDMQILSELIASMLSDIDDDVDFLFALNGKEACKLAAKEMPDLIIMDWEMPEMNGIDALIKLKKFVNTADIPVIITSAFSNNESIQHALEAGAIDFLRKPIDSIELLARTRSALSLSSAYIKLKEKTQLLTQANQQTETLLKGYLPEVIVSEIMLDGYSRPKRYNNVSILFADLVDFTSKTNEIDAETLFSEVNDIFPAFDKLAEYNNCIKIKTIGDAYVAACGLPVDNPQHAQNIAKLALDMRSYMNERNLHKPITWKIKFGICSGRVIAGLIGNENYNFDIFGDTMNTAARMQQYSMPMQINLSKNSAKLLAADYKIIDRVPMAVKGKGIQTMHFLHFHKTEGHHPDFKHHPLFAKLIEPNSSNI